MVSVPAIAPVTTPEPVTVAVLLLEVQVPPIGELLRLMVVPVHTALPPFIAPTTGTVITDIIVIALSVHPKLFVLV